MPPKKKKIKKKDPKAISQTVKQSVVIKIGDTSTKKKRTYTKRAHITPKTQPQTQPQQQLILQPQRIEPVSRLDPSIEKLKMSVNQFDDLSKQTNDLLQRISRTNLIQAQEQLKPAPIVESLIEQPFQTPASPEPKTKSKQKKITEFMTPQYTRLEPQFRDKLGLSPSTQTLNDFFESSVESPNTGSQVGLSIPQTTDRKLILEEPDDPEQVSAQELSSGAAIVGTTPAEEEESDEEPFEELVARVARENKEKEASGAGPAEEPVKIRSDDEILAESKAIKARQKEEKAQVAEATKQSKLEAIRAFEIEKQEKVQRETDAAYEILKANNGVFPPKVGRPTQAESNAMARWKFEASKRQAARQAEATVDVPVSEAGILSPDPAGGIITLNEASGTGPTAPGLDKLLDVPIALSPTPTSEPAPASETPSAKGAGRPAGSKGKTDEEKQIEKATHREEVQRILGILRTSSGIYVSGKRGPLSQAEAAARLAYTNEQATKGSKLKARVDAKKK